MYLIEKDEDSGRYYQGLYPPYYKARFSVYAPQDAFNAVIIPTIEEAIKLRDVLINSGNTGATIKKLGI